MVLVSGGGAEGDGARDGELGEIPGSALAVGEGATGVVRWLEPGPILFMSIIVDLLVVSALLPLSQLSTQL